MMNRKSLVGMRPSFVRTLSWYVVIPSICYNGRNRFGYNIGEWPKISRSCSIHLWALLRCTICVYLWENTSRS